MESVSNENEIQSLKDNRITGSPSLSNSTISFAGTGNVLYCENNVRIVNSSIRFEGNNSLVYLSSTNGFYPLNLQIYQDSLFYIGKNNNLTPTVNINLQEHQNIIIGDDGIIGSNVNIRTSDAHPIYSNDSKKRINHSKSVYIGDHVWLGHQAYIDKGSVIGSGAIINNNSYVEGNIMLESNNLYSGNPVRIIKSDVFFTKEYVGGFRAQDSVDIEEYTSRIFLYSEKPGETLSSEKLDELFLNFNVDEKIDFIQKLFIQSKKHDRFSI